MIQIQRGQVKYKDRTDYYVEYADVSGKQYYFINKLANGSYIATTSLVEAIDFSVKPVSLGVINSDGLEVIPFENRSIKSVNDKYLLVEPSNLVSPSVIESAEAKSDPLSATRLVTTAATIKDNINTKTNGEARFIFNDQCSEATIYDYSGNNVLNNEYYSFIATTDDSFYFSKNQVDSPVLEYSFVEQEKKEEPVNEVKAEEVVDTESNALDVSNISIDKDELENQIVEQTSTEEVQAPVEEVQDSLVEEDNTIEDKKTSENNEEVVSDTALDIENKEVNEVNTVDYNFSIPNIDSFGDKQEVKQKFDDEFKLSVDDYKEEVSNDNEFKSEYQSDNYSIKDNYYEEDRNSVLPTAISTMNSLISQNKNQREKIDDLSSKNSSLQDRIINFEDTVKRLESQNRQMDDKIRSQADELRNKNDIIEKQNREINLLKDKIEAQHRSESDLAELLKTAQGVLRQDDRSYDYEDSYSYGKRIA